ncbi:MAG TPA: CDP-glycerol glycerophosphotransferase family protein [Anaerolineaceae bacterium]|nr:CDP-glycerol glycerophosphotransferase family protein [Anaerolineaceae bacterium]
MTANILLICGSLNQTTMMHRISEHLSGCRCYFTPFYATGLLGAFSKIGLLDFSILGGKHLKATQAYLAAHNLSVDYGGKAREYDAVITCTDLIVPGNIRGRRLILVQEGITEPEDFSFTLVRRLKLPRFIANTAATGLSDAYDFFCVASPGYRDFFVRKGVRRDKIVVTGIPNFDNARTFLANDFPEKHYVLVATSSVRETGKWDNRAQFLEKVGQIAGDRPLIFKLHPNENARRARREIEAVFPQANIYTEGNTNAMIANCDVLITQYSSVVYVGLALGKEVYSNFDVAELRRLMPIQNEGRSAQRIAEVCKQVVRTSLRHLRRPEARRRLSRKWRFSDG